MRSEEIASEYAAAVRKEIEADAEIARARAGEAVAADEFSRRTEALSASYAKAMVTAQELLDDDDAPGPAADDVARAHRDMLRDFHAALEAELQIWRAELDRLGAWADRARADVKEQLTLRMMADDLRKTHERVRAKLQALNPGDHGS